MGLNRLLLEGYFLRGPKFEGAGLATGKSKMALLFSILTLSWSNLAPMQGSIQPQILEPKQPHLSGAELAPKTVPFWTHPFRPHFWGQIGSFLFTVYVLRLHTRSQVCLQYSFNLFLLFWHVREKKNYAQVKTITNNSTFVTYQSGS